MHKHYSGPMTDHFDGTRFYNQDRLSEPSFKNFLAWLITRKPGVWLEQNHMPLPAEKPPACVEGTRLRVTFVNHATFLIQTEGVNLLTDPIWSQRASPVWFAGPRRMRRPGIMPEDLPPIDVIMISHNHYDHLDAPTLKRLACNHNAMVITTLGNAQLIKKQGVARVVELDWWEEVAVSDTVSIVCVPAQHFSGRGLFDHYKTLWGGFVIQTKGGTVYFAGDTGYGPHIEQIAERFRPLRLALLPIGAFVPEWFMSFAHMSPADAVQAHLALGAQTSIGMHYGTFPLADDGQEDPVRALCEILSKTDLYGTEFWLLKNGEARDVPMAE
ncbi:MAG: MBL fold metallo-hydrolase [Desulfobacterota bacterium]|nr:MBL fold metallo-hydrolase [Thermodesulfobacteriota bacterium]